MAAEDKGEGDDKEFVVRRGPVGRQIKRARKDGWTARRRGIFLDHLRVTCNVPGRGIRTAAPRRR